MNAFLDLTVSNSTIPLTDPVGIRRKIIAPLGLSSVFL